MASNPIVWFEIYVQDMARARRFYEAMLGVELKGLDAPIPGLDMLTFPSSMEAYGASGALVKFEGCPSGGGGTLVYFHCEDCAVEETRAVAAGGKVHKAKFSIGPHGFCSLVYDSEGNLVGLHSMA